MRTKNEHLGSKKGKKQYGVTDKPVDKTDDDLLNNNAYATGLCEFIINCPTPMSISLQGDWGSGKSSLLNFIQNTLEDDKHKMKTIFVNTWQFSQMEQEGKLFKTFFLALLDSMNISSEANKDIFKKAAVILGGLAVGAVGGNAGAVDDLVKSSENIQVVKTLNKKFKEAVEESIEKHNEKHKGKKELDEDDRLVILVDDLDRLNPEVAVELLEIIKLFMDVERCVFVLAIDYDVVVQGVKNKFGIDISIEKCRSFFDKIIQLPFHMPMKDYKLDGIMRKDLEDKLPREHIERISKFAAEAFSGNPRAVKRAINSFLLLETIQKNLKTNKEEPYTPIDNAVLFCILCIQIRHTPLYNYLSDTEAWKESESPVPTKDDDDNESVERKLHSILNTYISEGEELSEKYSNQLYHLLVELEKTLNIIGVRDYENFAKIISLSAVTMREIEASGKSRSNIIPVPDEVTIGGEPIEKAKKWSTLYISMVSKLISQHHNKTDLLLHRHPSIVSKDGNKMRQPRPVDILGEKYFIEVNSQTPEKKRNLLKICDIFGIDKESIVLDGIPLGSESK